MRWSVKAVMEAGGALACLCLCPRPSSHNIKCVIPQGPGHYREPAPDPAGGGRDLSRMPWDSPGWMLKYLWKGRGGAQVGRSSDACAHPPAGLEGVQAAGTSDKYLQTGTASSLQGPHHLQLPDSGSSRAGIRPGAYRCPMGPL